jgi:hypothetical protein
MDKQIVVIDIPADATTEDAELAMTAEYERDYYAVAAIPWGNFGARFFFVKRREQAKSVNGMPPNDDGREDEAVALLRAHPDTAVMELVMRLREAGIYRGRNWVSGRLKLMVADRG